MRRKRYKNFDFINEELDKCLLAIKENTLSLNEINEEKNDEIRDGMLKLDDWLIIYINLLIMKMINW